eukprot:5239700-Pyramimonas_sp.AAC.1
MVTSIPPETDIRLVHGPRRRISSVPLVARSCEETRPLHPQNSRIILGPSLPRGEGPPIRKIETQTMIRSVTRVGTFSNTSRFTTSPWCQMSCSLRQARNRPFYFARESATMHLIRIRIHT